MERTRACSRFTRFAFNSVKNLEASYSFCFVYVTNAPSFSTKTPGWISEQHWWNFAFLNSSPTLTGNAAKTEVEGYTTGRFWTQWPKQRALLRNPAKHLTVSQLYPSNFLLETPLKSCQDFTLSRTKITDPFLKTNRIGLYFGSSRELPRSFKWSLGSKITQRSIQSSPLLLPVFF